MNSIKKIERKAFWFECTNFSFKPTYLPTDRPTDPPIFVKNCDLQIGVVDTTANNQHHHVT